MPSNAFINAIINSGTSCDILCEWCGRIHFSSWEPWCYDNKKELEDLQLKAKEEPDKYIEWASETIHWGNFDGKQIVFGCLCNNKLDRFEEWIWKHKYIISDYFKERTKLELERAELQKNMLEVNL